MNEEQWTLNGKNVYIFFNEKKKKKKWDRKKLYGYGLELWNINA